MSAPRDTARPASLYRYRFGTAEFDEARFELRVAGLAVEVQRKPLELLQRLLAHAGEVVTKEELLETVWDGRPTVDNVVANAITKLRGALGAGNADRIITQPRVGYRFAGPLERVAVGRALVSSLELQAGAAVHSRPNFILDSMIGRSAGSEVWLARHAKTHERRVYKFSPDGGRLAALKREATLSRLLRENLGERDDFARVIDWNFETPPFFLECEYGGQSLLEWADAGERLVSLTIEERLALFLQIADAVAAAHGIGVLHKDLKPANVLVYGDGAANWKIRLTDFGSSRLLEPERLAELGITQLGLTMTGGSMLDSTSGTPLYLAPELIAGAPPTVRSDVYALGVMLYQMLIGDLRQPMAPGWERNIADELVREDLARATDGDPQRRLASAAALTQSLRHLEHRRLARERERTVTQEAQRAHTELQRARARRPWVVATVCVLTMGLCASVWLAAQAERARARAEEQSAHAQAVSGFLQDLLANADPAAAGENDLSVRDALGRAAANLESRFADAPLAEAAVRLTAGDLYASLGEAPTSLAHVKRAVSLLESNLGADAPRTLHARYRFGEVLTNASEYAQAESVLNAADLDAAAVRETDTRLALSAERAWGRYYLRQARAADALPRLQNAERRQLQVDPRDVLALHSIRMDLAQAYSHSGRPQEAVALMEQLQSPAYSGINEAQRARATLIHGAALLYAGRSDDAEPVLLSAIAALSKIYGDGSLQSAQARSALGGLYVSSGRFAEALPHVVASRNTMCKLHGAAAQSCLMQIGNEGVVLLQMGDAAAAILPLSEARAAFESQAGADSVGAHVLGFYLASASLENGDAARAAQLLESLDPALIESGSPGAQWKERIAALEGSILIAQQQRDEGLALLKPAITAMQAGGMQTWILTPFLERLAQAEKGD